MPALNGPSSCGSVSTTTAAPVSSPFPPRRWAARAAASPPRRPPRPPRCPGRSRRRGVGQRAPDAVWVALGEDVADCRLDAANDEEGSGLRGLIGRRDVGADAVERRSKSLRCLLVLGQRRAAGDLDLEEEGARDRRPLDDELEEADEAGLDRLAPAAGADRGFEQAHPEPLDPGLIPLTEAVLEAVEVLITACGARRCIRAPPAPRPRRSPAAPSTSTSRTRRAASSPPTR